MDEDEPSGKVYDMDILIASPEHQNKGYGTSAIRLLINYMYDELGLKHFTIYTLTLNKRAIRSFKKAGFKYDREFSDEKSVNWIKLKIDMILLFLI